MKAYGRLWELSGSSPEAKAVKSMQEIVKNKVKVVNMGGPRRKKKAGEEEINPFTASLEKKRRMKEIEEAKRKAQEEAQKSGAPATGQAPASPKDAAEAMTGTPSGGQ